MDIYYVVLLCALSFLIGGMAVFFPMSHALGKSEDGREELSVALAAEKQVGRVVADASKKAIDDLAEKNKKLQKQFEDAKVKAIKPTLFGTKTTGPAQANAWGKQAPSKKAIKKDG